MLTWLGSLIGGPIITGLTNAYTKYLDKKMNTEALSTELAKKAIEAEMEDAREARNVIRAEQGAWYTAIIRPLLALPVVIYFWKLMVWDKVLGLGTTDALSPMLTEWSGLIIVTYVGGRSLEKIARSFWK